jgi:hypothetical protein
VRHFFKLLAFIPLFAITSGLAYAGDRECGAGFLSAMARQLGIKDLRPRTDGGTLVGGACAVWRHDRHIMLSAFAYDTGVADAKTLVVATTDAKTARVLSRYTAAIEEDATMQVDEASVRLDTARYQLSKEVTAFGVRFTSNARGVRGAEASSNDELTLFVAEGSKLRPVMHLYMFQQKSLVGWLNSAMEESVWENATLSISTAKTSTNGYADLLVTANIAPDSAGDQLPKPRKEHHLLRYDGTQYQRGGDAPWWIGWP